MPPPLIQYAELDALLYHVVAEAIMRTSPIGSSTLILPPDHINIDTPIDVFMSGKVVARGKVRFVGQKGCAQKWGKMTIGVGKIVVLLTKILCSGTKPSFSYASLTDAEDKWDRNDTTLKQIFEERSNPVVVFCTSSILVPINIENGQTEDDKVMLIRESEAREKHHLFNKCQ